MSPRAGMISLPLSLSNLNLLTGDDSTVELAINPLDPGDIVFDRCRNTAGTLTSLIISSSNSISVRACCVVRDLSISLQIHVRLIAGHALDCEAMEVRATSLDQAVAGKMFFSVQGGLLALNV